MYAQFSLTVGIVEREREMEAEEEGLRCLLGEEGANFSSDDSRLKQLGYKQDLHRSLSYEFINSPFF